MKNNRGNGNELSDYRIIQASLAIHRDGGLCVRCYWNGIIRPYEHVHHVFGRGTHVGDSQEDYYNLLCLCAECHDKLSAVRVPLKEVHREQMILLAFANAHPINPEFEHNFDEQD